MKRIKYEERLLSTITRVAAWSVVSLLVFLVAFILIRGLPHFSWDLFAQTYTSDNVSMYPAIVSTVYITALTLCIAVPLGVATAIYLTEYAKRGNRVVQLVRVTTEALAGIPSIVYGLFGMLFFTIALGWSYSLMAGACTLSMMVLPLIMRSSEEALLAVPDSYREGAFSLGAGKLRTVFTVVLPPAMPGILAGVVLSVGRIIGETAALVFTAGTVAQIPSTPFQSVRTLAVHMYQLSNEALHTNEGYATAVIILVVVIAINGISGLIARKVGAKN